MMDVLMDCQLDCLAIFTAPNSFQVRLQHGSGKARLLWFLGSERILFLEDRLGLLLGRCVPTGNFDLQ